VQLIKSTITNFLILLSVLILRPGIADTNNTGNTNGIIRLATTTSTDNSGLLSYLLPAFENKTGYRVHVIAVGTGKALRIGRDGDADVLLVHAPEAEVFFVKSGYGEQRHFVMYNDFVLVGPSSDTDNVQINSDINKALQQIAERKSTFISRGDNSGTHKKELGLWKEAGVSPQGEWYLEVGQGMGKVLQMAAELDAYTLTDRGTWLAYMHKSSLKIHSQGDPKLYNPYHIIAVSQERFPSINYQGANSLISWITSATGQSLIGKFSINDTLLFKPSANAQLIAGQKTSP